MGKKLEFTAEDPKAGMTLSELERAVEAAKEAAAPLEELRPKLVVGLAGQIKSLSVKIL